MAAFPSASSSQVPYGKYKVFISFRGSDVRYGFLRYLTNALRQQKIDVYVDDMLERGEEISAALVEAIKASIIALVIFSKHYASSKWCLEELVNIMECKEANQQIVIPIFYHVDPEDVRHQKHTYAKAFTHHEDKFKNNLAKLESWRSVLKKTADLSGLHSSNFQDEPELILAIVENVLSKMQVPGRKHEVFISFRGLDVRYGFLSHLTYALRQQKILVFENEILEREEEISAALTKAIEASMIALVIFSEDYAYSKWCLEELVKIMECKEANPQIVIPVFYHVDPSDVSHQRGSYADAFAHHEHKFRNNVVQNWRSILTMTAQLSGYLSSNFQNECELVHAIVEEVLRLVEVLRFT